jgi:hypothetical protein
MTYRGLPRRSPWQRTIMEVSREVMEIFRGPNLLDLGMYCFWAVDLINSYSNRFLAPR